MNKKLDDFIQLSEDAGSLQIRGFYREKEFKETEIGRIPKDWDVVRLGKVVEIWDKYRVPVKEQNRKPGPFPYCGANGIIDYVDGYTHEGEFILLAEDGGFFGPFENSAYIMKRKFWANNHVHILKAIEGVLTNEFLVYYLNFMNLVPFLTGSTRPKLTQEDMKKIPIVLPPLQEQQKIAEVLSTIDSAIQKVNESIERAERIKKALMKELLSGRVRVREENGSLTFWKEKEFKETEIGRIPKDWDVNKVVNLFDLYKGTTPSTKFEEYWNGSIPFVTPTDITKISGIYLDKTEKYITEEGLKSKGLKLVPRNSLLFTSRATIGYLAINRFEVAINQGIISLIPNNQKIDVVFFYYYLQRLKNLFESLAGGSTYKEISMSSFRNVIIPLPPLQEQQKTAEILSQWDKIIELKKAKKEKLERMKKKAMELLLTGKVRIA
jgi:type I restriction enzyme S subunit